MFWWRKIKITEINQCSVPRRLMLHWHCHFYGVSSQTRAPGKPHRSIITFQQGDGSWGLPPHQSNIAWLWAIIPKPPIIHFSALHSSPPDPLAARLLSISHTHMYTYTHIRCVQMLPPGSRRYVVCVCSVAYQPGEAKARNNNKEAEYPLQEICLLIF